MINGPFLKAFSLPALALSALLPTTPVLAVTSDEQANAKRVHQADQQVALVITLMRLNNFLLPNE